MVNKLVFPNGLLMEQNDCIYKRENTTIVSICNGGARNRTVGRDEAQRGINQLIKDCGADGAFSGAHVVNNLTFAAYGVFGGNMLKGPPGKPDPETPGTTVRFFTLPLSFSCGNHVFVCTATDMDCLGRAPLLSTLFSDAATHAKP